MADELTHLDPNGMPRMVDVSGKPASLRVARAIAHVAFPLDIARQLRDGGYQSKKGAILQTAIIAGVMAAKRTHELIPFCHALSLQHCEVTITPDAQGQLEIQSSCALHANTGVEMEALTAASVAALTIYDMTKALSHDIRISEIRLLEKSGGKRGFVSA